MQKRRVTVTVDDELLSGATAAVASGRAESVSAWVSDAMTARLERDRRLDALGQLIADYETRNGVITDDELAEQALADRDAAALVRVKTRRAG
jgi:Arc/MetJ-type ribon-helix-helix transcriptional regulator